MSEIIDEAIACSLMDQFVSWVAKRDAVTKFEHGRKSYTANNYP